MTKNIITIGRQFGSNGRVIGSMLAKKLNYAFYDKELINEAAKQSGLSESFLRSIDERPSKSFLYSLVMDPYSFGVSPAGYQGNLNQQAFQATYDTIKTLADKGPCVIVGRCADYALRHNPNLVRIFIYAPLEDRINATMEKFDLSRDKAKIQVIKEDKSRASYYSYYTSKKWASLDSYDICINSSLMNDEATVDHIIDYLNKIK